MKPFLALAVLATMIGCSSGEMSDKDAATAANNFSRKPTAEENAKAEKTRLPPP